MSTWISATEYRTSGAKQLGLALNPAFFQEIKADHTEFRQMLDHVVGRWSQTHIPINRQSVEEMIQLRDAIESYFALEEFYGFLPTKRAISSKIVQVAIKLQSQHRDLFLELSEIIEIMEQQLYHERRVSSNEVSQRIQQFYQNWCEHEQQEMKLLQRSHNEELGGSG